jgi:hypothetical protein
MSEHDRKTGWLARRGARRLLEQDRTGDSPEKLAQHHTPKGGVVDLMLKLGGVERKSRFKR